ncbi:MAG: hypothetical protein ACR2QH_17770 [Geminicoccaceae bacterium]
MLRASFEHGAEGIIVHFRGDLPLAQARLPDWLYQFIHPAYLTRAGYIAQLLQYQLVDGLAQIANLEKGQTWIHASVVEKNGYRTAIVADGGMGKTGSLLRLIGPDAWSYLSDDWTTLEQTGFVHRSRKPIQLYPRNLSRDMESGLLCKLSFSSRLAWRVRKRLGRRRGLRRKVDADQLFGSNTLGTPGPLDEVLYIEREEVEDIVEHDVDAATLARGAGAIVANELAPSMKLLSPHLQTISRGKLTSVDAVASQTVRVLQDAVADCRRTRVTVPYDMPEKQIEDYLVDCVDRLQ